MAHIYFQEGDQIKCQQYWPESGQTIYHDITVESMTTTIYSFFVERQFTMTQDKCLRTLTHLQYTNWPDHGVPKSADEILYLYYKIKALEKKGPLLVHCSAGVGRTGTFIALDNLVEQSRVEHKVNVVKCVSSMRNDRCEMVQSASQYK